MSSYSDQDIKTYLTARNIEVQSYYIEQGPFGVTIGYQAADGNEYDLAINDEKFAEEVIDYLKRHKVRIVTWTADGEKYTE